MHPRIKLLQAVTENLMADETTRELLLAAELGNADAQLQIGWLYSYEGWGDDDVADEAVKWLERAAEQGHVEAQYGLAYACCPEFDRDLPPLRNDPAATLIWMRAAAEQGHSEAIDHMGEIYERGLAGVSKDIAEAVKWYLKSTRRSGRVSYPLIEILKTREWQLDKENEAWLIAAVHKKAESGDVHAQRQLGGIYAHGLHWLAQSDEEATKWHSLAVADGEECTVIPFDSKEIDVFRRNADRCSAKLQRCLGQQFEKGKDLAADIAEAAIWYERSARQGDAHSQWSIAIMYAHGQGVSQNDEMAAAWCRKAAGQGIPAAQNNLGVMYASGRGLKKSHRQARRWYLAAARQGDSTALYNLGLIYLFGQGVSESDAVAERWFRASSHHGYVWASVALAALTGLDTDLIHAIEALFRDPRESLFSGTNDCVAQVEEFRERLAALSERRMAPSGGAVWESDWDEQSDRVVWWKNLSVRARAATTLCGMLWLVGDAQDEAAARTCFTLAARNRDRVADYYLAKLASGTGAYDQALKHVQPTPNWKYVHSASGDESDELCYSREFLNSLESQIREMAEGIRESKAKEEMRQAEIKAAEETHKQTLSFLTHTLNNALSTGPETVRTVIEILGSGLYDQGQAEYKAINNMASLFPVFLFTESLLKTFKLYVSDPEQVREKWKSDRAGDATVSLVMAMALRQSVARFVFSPNHLAQLQRLLPGRDKEAIKNVRKSFVEEIIPLEITVVTAGKMLDWVKAHFGSLHVTINTNAEMHFGSNATRYMFFFAAFSELIYNALKYSDGARPIEVRWFRDGSDFCFTCQNSFDVVESGQQSQEGTNKGLFFVDKLMAMLDGSALNYAHEADDFHASLRFGHDNFGESNA